MTWTINMEQTGARIEELRERSGYSVKGLREAIGTISLQAIYKWEHGESVPTLDNLLILSELFHVPIDQIIVRDSHEDKEDTGASATEQIVK